MSTDLTPPVPELADDRLALRRAHLVAELARPAHVARSRARRRVGYGVGVTGAAGAATVLLIGGGASPAFASWTADPSPTTPSLADCPTAGGSGTPFLAEKRGDYTLTMVEDGDSFSTCLSGDGIQAGSTSVSAGGGTPAPGTVTLGPGAGLSSAGGAGTAVISGSASAQSATTGNGPADGTAPTAMSASPGEFVLQTKDGGVALVDGRVGSGVSKVSVVRSDGTTVDATVKGTWFAAWWPGTATAKTLVWTTADGAAHSSDVPKQPGPGDVPPPGAVTSVNGPESGTATLQSAP